MKAQSGFTLVELMIVVVLAGIILAIITLNFTQLNSKYSAESSIKEIYSTLMRARNDATTTNTSRLVVLAANQIQTGVDTDGNNVIDGVPAAFSYPRFTINCNVLIPTPCGGTTIAFDRRGLANNNQTISITGFSAGTAPAIDCIVISATRINTGIMTGGTCVQR